MTARPAAAWGGALLLLLAAWGAIAQDSPAGLVPIPEPALDRMEPAVRSQIQEQLALVRSLAAKPGVPPADLAMAYGGAGQIFLAYDLEDAAEACFGNAAALEPEEERWVYYLATIHQEQRRLAEAAAGYERVLAGHPGDLPSLLRLGEVRLEEDRPELARAAFERALGLDPQGPQRAAARYGLGRAAAAEKDFARAVEHFEAALALAPEATVVHYPLGLAYRELGRLDEARSHLGRRGTTRVPFPDPLVDGLSRLATGGGAHLNRGLSAVAAGDYARAVEEYRKAIAADPENGPLRQALAFALERSGDAEGALEQYREAVRLKPDSPMAHFNLAAVLARREEGRSEALGHLERAVELAPDFEAAYSELGSLLAAEGRFAEAVPRLEKAVALDPGDRVARLRLARALRAAGREEPARRELDRLLAADPADPEALLELAAALTAAGDTEGAAARLSAVLAAPAEPPQKARAEFALAEIAQARGDATAAIAHYRAAIVHGPKFRNAHFNLATLLAERGALPEAARHFDAALEIEPRDREARRRRALVHERLGRTAEALADLERLAAEAPQDAAARLELGAALGRAGRYRDAAAAYGEAAKAAPAEARAHFGRATALILAGDDRAARAALEEGLARLPESVPLSHALARLLATSRDAAVRDGARALELARAVLAAERTVDHSETVAMALAELGRFEEAVAWQGRLADEAARAGLPEGEVRRLRDQIERYRKGEPSRMGPADAPSSGRGTGR